MTVTDEQFATDLRARALLVAPPMSLDVGEAVRRGARHRRARLLARAAAATAAVATVAVVAVAALGGARGVTAPAAQAPRTIGTGQVVELAPGITASNALTPTTASDGREWWDTGLRFGYPVGSGTLSVILHAFDESIPWNPVWDGAPGGDDILQAVDEPEGQALSLWPALALAWPTSGGPELGGGGYAGHAGTGPAGTDADAAYVVAGTVPTWVPAPRVALLLPEPWPAAGGGTTSWLELPTVPDPSGSGQLVFAAVIASPNWPAGRPGPDVYVVAGDGSGAIAGSPCGVEAVAACFPEDAGPGLAEAVTALGGTVPDAG